MEKRKKAVRILLTAFVWLIFAVVCGGIFYLSSQDGEETTNLSLNFTNKLAGYLLENPNQQQINVLHMLLRKIAHPIVFTVMGTMLSLALLATFGVKRFYILLAGIPISYFFAYFDEYHKNFIDGRHYSHQEQMLNFNAAAGAILFVMIIGIFAYLFEICKGKSKDKANKN